MWLVYIKVDNLEGSVARAEELGAKVLMGKTPVPEMGTFAVLMDPQGAAFAIWEPSKKE